MRYVLILVGVWSMLVFLLAFFQRSLIYHPARVSVPLPPAVMQDRYPAIRTVRPVVLQASNGETVRGWYMPCDGPTRVPDVGRKLVLFFHGNAGHRGSRGPWYAIFQRAGCDVLAIDYRGYGDSEGKPTQRHLQEDAGLAWDYAVNDLGYSEGDLVVFGVSLGGGVAVQLAADRCRHNVPPAALVTVATFDSLVRTAGGHYPWVPVGAVLKDRFDSAAAIADVTCPFVTVHGDADTIVPFERGQALYDAAPRQSASGVKTKLIKIPGAGHNRLADEAAGEILGELDRLLSK